MRIAIVSDSHDNIWKLKNALPHFKSADVLLHCGDIVAPFMIIQLINGIEGKPVHIIWGNNDGDKRLLTEVAANAKNVHLHGDFALLDFNGFRIAMNHYPNVALALAKSGQYDLVCYGHDHICNKAQIGDTLLVNPGELMGMNNQSTFAVYDTENRKVEFIEIL